MPIELHIGVPGNYPSHYNDLRLALQSAGRLSATQCYNDAAGASRLHQTFSLYISEVLCGCLCIFLSSILLILFQFWLALGHHGILLMPVQNDLSPRLCQIGARLLWLGQYLGTRTLMQKTKTKKYVISTLVSRQISPFKRTQKSLVSRQISRSFDSVSKHI